MKIILCSHDDNMTSNLKDYAERRLHFALGRFAPSLQKVTVRFFDLNGPRGGRDKACRILVNMNQGEPIVLEEVGDDYYPAIDRAAERIGRKVARRVEKKRDRNRRFVPLWGWKNLNDALS